LGREPPKAALAGDLARSFRAANRSGLLLFADPQAAQLRKTLLDKVAFERALAGDRKS
jgi:hypothetical protein